MKQRILNKLKKANKWLVFSINFLFVVTLGFMDYLTGVEFSFSIFYFLPIIVVAWHTGKMIGLIFSLFCSLAWLLADYFGGHSYSSNLLFIWNVFVPSVIFISVSQMIGQRKNIMESEISEQKIKSVSETSRRLTAILAERVIKHNSNILLWISKRKLGGKNVPKELENSANHIGMNFKALSEISFGQPSEEKGLNLDEYAKFLDEKLAEVNKES